MPPGEEELLAAKGDPRLLAAVRNGGSEPFVALAAFRGDAFLRHSAKREHSSIPLLNEFGNAAFFLLRPAEVVPFLKDPGVLRLAWFCPKGRLVRLDPALEMDVMGRFGAGTGREDREILLRWKDVPGDEDGRAVAAAGFRIVTRAGPNLVVSGPLSGVPGLLEIDRIIHLEKASKP